MVFQSCLSVFPLVKLQLQATSVGEVVIKGVCANRYLAMNRDGRLFGAVSGHSSSRKIKISGCFVNGQMDE